MGEIIATKAQSGNAVRRGERSLTGLRLALVLTFFYMIAEVVGGLLTNSLALLADAGHMLTDVASLSLTLAAIWFAAKPATPDKTYGYYRLEIFAAFVNGVALAALSLWVIWEAYGRWLAPPEVLGEGMTLVAFGGLLVNLVAVWLLHGSHDHDLNMRGAWLHVVGDALGSVAAIGAGLVIIFLGWRWADSAASVLISVIIIYGAWKLIKDSVHVLLEGVPSHINLTAVENSLKRIPGVTDVHDLHVWTITSGIDSLSVHVVKEPREDQNQLLRGIQEQIADEFNIDHLTVQIEEIPADELEAHSCFSGANCFGPDTIGTRGAGTIQIE